MDEHDLRQRCVALAIEVRPERVVERAEEYLAFVKGTSCGRSLPPEGTLRTDQGSD